MRATIALTRFGVEKILEGIMKSGEDGMVEFSRHELSLLTQKAQGPCISVYMPAHRAGAEVRQDPIRLKNLLGEAETKLGESGLRSTQARALLEPARELLNDALFWRYQSDGLALFLSSGFFRYYRVPLEFDDLVVVTHRFHIKPLLRLFAGDGVFYVLALSQNDVRLLQGTRYSVNQVELENVPDSLADALKYDDPEKQLQFHTGASEGKGRRAAIFHGHGVGVDDTKDRILRYFRQINEGVQELLKDGQAPLVLAGVDYLFPIYEAANTYRHLISEGIPGNPEALSATDLHERAWSIVKPYFRKAQNEATSRYKTLAASGQASNDLKSILPASYQGRIEVLLVAVGVQRWGSFDPSTSVVQLHPAADPDSEDLLDLATLQTLVNGGTVFALEPGDVPGEALFAAIFRY